MMMLAVEAAGQHAARSSRARGSWPSCSSTSSRRRWNTAAGLRRFDLERQAWSASRRRRGAPRPGSRPGAGRARSIPCASGRRGRARTTIPSRSARTIPDPRSSDSGPSIWTWPPMRPSAPRQQHGEARRRHVRSARQDGEGARLAAPLGRPHGVAHGDVAHQRRQHLGMKRRQRVEAACVPAATPRCRAAPRRCACAGCATAATSRRRCCRAGSRPSGSAPRRCPRPRGGTRRDSRWPRHRRRRPARPGGTTAHRRAAPAATARARSPPCCGYRGRRTKAHAAAPCAAAAARSLRSG